MTDTETFPEHLTIVSMRGGAGGRNDDGYASDLETEELRRRIDRILKDQYGGKKPSKKMSKKKSKKASKKKASRRKSSKKKSTQAGGKKKKSTTGKTKRVLGDGPKAYMRIVAHVYKVYKKSGKSYRDAISKAKQLWDANSKLEGQHKERADAAIKHFDSSSR